MELKTPGRSSSQGSKSLVNCGFSALGELRRAAGSLQAVLCLKDAELNADECP